MLFCSESCFRMKKIRLIDNPIFKDITIDFSSGYTSKPFTTVLLGVNGTGKSYLLCEIINIFRDINHLINTGERSYDYTGRFYINYSLNGKDYQVSNLDYALVGIDNPLFANDLSKTKNIWVLCNQSKIEYKDIVIPKKILANSIMLTDKFPYIKKNDFPSYKYLGVRREGSPSVAGTRTYIRKTVDFLVASLINNSKKDFLDKVIDVLRFLGLDDEITITYPPQVKHLFYNGKLTIELFCEYFNNWPKYFTRRKNIADNEPWGKKYFDKIKNDPDKLKKIVEFLNRLSNEKVSIGPRAEVIKYDLLNDERIQNDYTLINELKNLELVRFPSVLLKKKSRELSLEYCSSGEVHLFSSLIALLVSVEKNSLILIDEPEISLHPNWQMKYIHFLKNIFKEYPCCHFIIASHSHFIVSDLDNDSSSIISMSRDDKNELKAESIIDEPYAWSAENILYKIFNVRTTRNYYIGSELSEMLKIISTSPENNNAKRRVNEIYNSLKELSLSPNDPLNDIIRNTREYLGAND